MNRQTAIRSHQRFQIATPVGSGVLQRKCACGNHTIADGECEECSKKKRFGLQTKLKVNEPGDIYEQEADRIADQVLTTPAHPAVSGAPPRIQRFLGQSNGQMDAVPASVDQALASPGRSLEPALRQDMERRFGHDFSRVRVHTDTRAAESARAVNARAYTVGHNIVFGAGWFAPGTHQGRRLIAHELTHVVQAPAGDGMIHRQPASGVAAGGHELTDAELLALANLSPVRVESSFDKRFEEVLIAANNGLIDIVTPAEFERQLRFRVERLGSTEFAQAWTDEERFSFAEAGAGERKALLAAKWASFIEQGYMAYLADRAAQWRSATRRMHTAAVIGNVIGEVTVTAATLFIGGGGGLASRRGGGATLARETSTTVLKREVEAVARNRAAEFADKAARLATKVVPAPDTDTDKRRKQKRDTCETLWGLRPGENARIFEQRAPIRGQTTVENVYFRLDRGIPPPIGGDTTEGSRAWVRGIGCPTDDAGHILANRFGGFAFYNNPRGNIFPQDLTFNRGQMNRLDEVVAKLHASGTDVCVLIHLSYEPDDSLRPTHGAYFIRARHPGFPDFVPVWDTPVRNESRDEGCTA